MDNIQLKSGKTLDDFWKLANAKGFVERGKVVSKHSEMLAWLKSKEIGLGHVHANFIILYLPLRTDDPKLSAQSRKWAHPTGVQGLREIISHHRKSSGSELKKCPLMIGHESAFGSGIKGTLG